MHAGFHRLSELRLVIVRKGLVHNNDEGSMGSQSFED
jgi:hypothetical protein